MAQEPRGPNTKPLTLTLTLKLTLLTPKTHIPLDLGTHVLWVLGWPLTLTLTLKLTLLTHSLDLGTLVLWVLGWAQGDAGNRGPKWPRDPGAPTLNPQP